MNDEQKITADEVLKKLGAGDALTLTFEQLAQSQMPAREKGKIQKKRLEQIRDYFLQKRLSGAPRPPWDMVRDAMRFMFGVIVHQQNALAMSINDKALLRDRLEESMRDVATLTAELEAIRSKEPDIVVASEAEANALISGAISGAGLRRIKAT